MIAMIPGAHPAPCGGTRFVVFTTIAKDVAVRLFEAGGKAPLRAERLLPRGDGLFEVALTDVGEGALYKFVLDDDEVPDPYARFLPFGVHGPARVVRPRQAAALSPSRPLDQLVIYELHVGAFTPEGTYRAAAQRLDDLAALGITAIELLPVHAFPGTRGWGYDGVALYAPYAPYGEPDDLRAFVRAAHERGLSVLLDVVYNHFGPSGNYLARYARSYFTTDAETPWGEGPAFADAHLRALVLDNVRYWLEEFGFDGLRLDATHAIHDRSRPHVLREITDLAHACDPARLVFFEDERNQPFVLRELGADGVWADDLHHQIHVLLTGERDGYYAAYEPTARALARCIGEGWTFSGQPFAPWDGRRRGAPFGDLPARLLTCVQNHDQVGNRARGERLSTLVDVDAYCAAIVLLLFLPFTPLLFMGQEWAASTPFLFFSDHEGEVGANVSKGRREEFRAFAAFRDPETLASLPDPQAASTFAASKLRWEEREREPHARVLALHRAMLELRRRDPVLSISPSSLSSSLEAEVREQVLAVTRRAPAGVRHLFVNLGATPAAARLPTGCQVLQVSGSWTEGALGSRAALLVAEA